MRSFAASWAFPLFLLVLTARVSAHWDWVKELPDCWQECLEDTKDGCDSSKCICDASQSSKYLPPAVSCAATKCEANDFALQMTFVLPLEVYCNSVDKAIPDDVMNSAYDAATATAAPTSRAQPATTHRPETHKSNSPMTTDKGNDRLTKVITSTVTTTTTDNQGRTLYIIVPIVMGPETMSVGKIVTSTAAKETSARTTPTSAAQRPTSEDSRPAPTQAGGQPQPASSTTSSQAAKKTSNSNGSLFENMQADASRWGVSGLFVGLGVAAGVFMRL